MKWSEQFRLSIERAKNVPNVVLNKRVLTDMLAEERARPKKVFLQKVDGDKYMIFNLCSRLDNRILRSVTMLRSSEYLGQPLDVDPS